MPAPTPFLLRASLVALLAFAGCSAPATSSAPAAAGTPAAPATPAPRARAIAAAATPAAGSSSRKDQLIDALADANRLVITPGAAGAATPAPRDLRGQYIVAEFLEALSFDEGHGPVRCDAPADAVLSFQRGDQVVGKLSIHRLGYVRWEGGPWVGDAVLEPASAQKLVQWATQSGADITSVVKQLAASQAARETEGRRRMLANFSGESLQAFASADSLVYQGNRLRWVATPLPEVMKDQAALAEAAFRGLDDRRLRWLEDDWGTGALQTVLLEMDPAIVEATMDRLYARDTAKGGIARLFFRSGFSSRMGAAARDLWLERLADTALRGGADRDKHAVLEFVAAIPGPAAAAFLKGVADGSRTYSHAPAYDDLSPVIEEPSLRHTAALLLAQRGEAGTAGIVNTLATANPFGPDRAAVELARMLLSPSALPSVTALKYRSRILGMAALRGLERAPASGLPVELLVAGLGHVDGDVVTGSRRLAIAHGLQQAEEQPSRFRPEESVDPLLATSHPKRAIELASALIPKAEGEELARLFAVRGHAYSALEDYAAAEVDFLNVERTPYAGELDIRTRLVWVQWYLGEFEAAEETIARALGEEPSSEVLLLRGLIHYTQGDFGAGTEADLTAAMVLDPTDDYPALFHHLVVSLGGRPNRSMLQSKLVAPLQGPEWPRHLMAYMLGVITAERLIELAEASDPSEVAWHGCEAHFYIAQAARLAGRPDEERKFLNLAIGFNQPHVAEFWLAKYRLAELAGRGPAAAPTPQQPPAGPRTPAPAPPRPAPERPPGARPPAI